MSNYGTEEVDFIFSDEFKLTMWAAIEASVLRVQAAAGLVPEEWARVAHETKAPDPEEWEAAIEDTGHEVTAFLKVWGPEHMHIGLTSSDLTDTTMAVRMSVFRSLLVKEGPEMVQALTARAMELNEVQRLARTHGQAAIPDSLGRRLGALAKQIERTGLQLVRDSQLPGKISGPVGSYASLGVSPEMENAVLGAMGLEANKFMLDSQIVARDHLARWANSAAEFMSALEAFCTDLRLMASFGEVQFVQSEGYTGSSAMPGKRNPFLAERVCGLARLTRAIASAITEGIVQWQDRDLVSSSVERDGMEAICGYVHYGIRAAGILIENMEFDLERIEQNLKEVEWGTGAHQRMTNLQLGGMGYFEARAEASK